MSRFALIAIGQAACGPLYLLAVTAGSGPALVALSIPTGLFAGGAFFPLIATAARRSPQLTPNLRAGLIVGGVWGGGSIVAITCGQLTRFGITARQILLAMAGTIAASAALALMLYIREKRRRRSTQSAATPPA